MCRYSYLLPETCRPRVAHSISITNARTSQKGKVVRGVKGVSYLMFVPGFDTIQSFSPEYMHSILLGVVKSVIVLVYKLS